jgi:hypothetical protein
MSPGPRRAHLSVFVTPQCDVFFADSCRFIANFPVAAIEKVSAALTLSRFSGIKKSISVWKNCNTLSWPGFCKGELTLSYARVVFERMESETGLMRSTAATFAMVLCLVGGMASSAHAAAIFSQDFEGLPVPLGPSESTFGAFTVNGTNANFDAGINGTMAMGHQGPYGGSAYDYYQISGLAIEANTTLEFDYVIAVEDEWDRFNLVAALTGQLNPPFGLIAPDSGMVYHNETVASAAPVQLGDTEARSQSGHAVFDLSAFAGSTIDVRFQFGSDVGVFDDGIIIDNIVVNVADPVSESDSLGLLGIALGGFIIAARRRRRQGRPS